MLLCSTIWIEPFPPNVLGRGLYGTPTCVEDRNLADIPVELERNACSLTSIEFAFTRVADEGT